MYEDSDTDDAAASDSDSCAETVPDNENKTEEPKAIVAVPTPSEPPSVDPAPAPPTEQPKPSLPLQPALSNVAESTGESCNFVSYIH